MGSNGRKYALTVGGGVCALALGIALGAWRAKDGGWLLVFADAFTLASVLMLSVAALMLISRSGFFDFFLYGTRRLAGLVIPPLGIYRESFYDYKARRGTRARPSLLPVLLVGSVFFAVSLVLSLVVGA